MTIRKSVTMMSATGTKWNIIGEKSAEPQLQLYDYIILSDK